MGEPRLEYIPTEKIVENKVALRGVDTDGESFRDLVASIAEKGIVDSINVREKTDDETGELMYEIINGLHRVTAAKELDLKTVPAQILDVDDAKALEVQVVANLMRVDTKASEYTKQLRRMLNMNPLLTIGELAGKLGCSPQWINDRLSLGKIQNETVLSLIDAGDIKLANAFALAKIPNEELTDWIEAAQVQEAAEFVPRINARIKEIRDAERKGRDAASPVFEPVAHARKVKDLKAEMETGEQGSILLDSLSISDPKSAWDLAIKWALNLDPTSVEAQRVKWDEREAARLEAKQKREAEKAAKKAKEAREKAEKAEKEAEEAAAAE